MKLRTKLVRAGVVLTISALVLTGCRGGDSGSDGDGDSASSPGVTSEPCPDAVNEDNGCIYLGTISDLTKGPFAPLAVPITEAQAAFWNRVNEQGGIDGYDVDVTKYVADSEYNPQIHNQKYQEMREDVLALAQSLGSTTTITILDDMKSDNIVAAPASWNSAWEFEPYVMESGSNYCFESMNGVDYAVAERGVKKGVVAVGYPGDYGGDSASGVEAAAKANDLEFTRVESPPGKENQKTAIGKILAADPDLVVAAVGPTEMAVIAGGLAQQGFQGTIVGNGPTWNPALLKTEAAPALKALYVQAGPWAPYGTDTPGHEAMREALGDVAPEKLNDGLTAGWAWSYPLLAALKKAGEDGDITRESLVEAAANLEEVDTEGMLPDGANVTKGDPSDVAFRETVVSKVDESAPTGVSIVQDFTAGPTAQSVEFSEPCFALQ